MSRTGAVCLLVLLTACGDLTRVPPPPVTLSALEGPLLASVDGSDGPEATRPAVRLVRALPPHALVSLHVPDLAGAMRRFKRTGLYRLLDSPELKSLLGTNDFFKFAALQITGNGKSPLDARRLMKALQGEIVFAVEDVQLRDGGAPEIRLVGGIGVGDNVDQAEQLIEFVSMAAAQQKGVRVEKGAVGQTSFSRIVDKDIVVELAVFGDALLAGLGRETVTDAIARLHDETQPSLAESEGYLACMKRCADPKDAFRLHVNLRALYEKYGHHMPKEARDILRSLGLDQLRSLAVAVKFEGVNIGVSTLLDSPGGDDFLTKLLRSHPVDRQFFATIPSSASSFSLFALDAHALLAQLRKVLPDDVRKEMEAGLKKLRDNGLDLERDVLDVFGPRAAIVNVPSGVSASNPLDAVWSHLLGTALVIEVQDPRRAQDLLDRIGQNDPTVRRRSYTVGGAGVVAIRFQGGQLPPDFALSYSLVDEYLVIAPAEETLRQMLLKRSAETEKRLRTATRDVPANAAVLSYDDMSQGPGLFLTAMLAGAMQSLGGRSADLPLWQSRIASVLSSFGPSLSWTIADDGGVLSVTHSPTGGFGSAGGLTGALVVAAIALPNLHVARMKANEAAAIATLRSIFVAQETFRANNVRDTDADGIGEFGYLAELLGKRRAGEKHLVAGSRLLLGDYARKGRDFMRNGYYFRVYLPAEDGSPVGEHLKKHRIAQVDGDLAESLMVVVAWPVDKGISGQRAFVMTARGDIQGCANGPYSGRKTPPPDILSSQKGNLASAPLRRGQRTRDGCDWSPARR